MTSNDSTSEAKDADDQNTRSSNGIITCSNTHTRTHTYTHTTN